MKVKNHLLFLTDDSQCIFEKNSKFWQSDNSFVFSYSLHYQYNCQ